VLRIFPTRPAFRAAMAWRRARIGVPALQQSFRTLIHGRQAEPPRAYRRWADLTPVGHPRRVSPRNGFL
jgi:hypothetical protein